MNMRFCDYPVIFKDMSRYHACQTWHGLAMKALNSLKMAPHHTLHFPTHTDNRMAHGHFQTNSIQSQPNPNQTSNPTNLSNPQLNPNPLNPTPPSNTPTARLGIQ